jgi:hypothetical protein
MNNYQNTKKTLVRLILCFLSLSLSLYIYIYIYILLSSSIFSCLGHILDYIYISFCLLPFSYVLIQRGREKKGFDSSMLSIGCFR